MTTWVAAAVGKWARLRQTLGESSGGPLTHSSYTTRGDTASRRPARESKVWLAGRIGARIKAARRRSQA